MCVYHAKNLMGIHQRQSYKKIPATPEDMEQWNQKCSKNQDTYALISINLLFDAFNRVFK